MRFSSLLAWLIVLLVAEGARAERAGMYEGKPIAHWVAQVVEGDAAHRADGMLALTEIGDVAVPEVLDLTRHPEATVRRAAVEILLRGVQRAALVTGRLEELLGDADAIVRARALQALFLLAPKHPSLGKAARGLLADAAPLVRRAAGEVLLEIEDDPAALVGELTKSLKAEDARVRLRAVGDLGRLAEKGTAARPALEALSGDPDLRVRLAACEAAAGLGADQGPWRDAVLVGLASTDVVIQREAGWSLVRLGKAAAPLVDKLRAYLDHPDGHVRIVVVEATWRATGDTKTCVKVLAKLMKWPGGLDVAGGGAPRLRAVRLLGEIGPAAGPAMPAFLEVLAIPGQHTLGEAVMHALPRMGPAAKAAVPALEAIAGGRMGAPPAYCALAQRTVDAIAR